MTVNTKLVQALASQGISLSGVDSVIPKFTSLADIPAGFVGVGQVAGNTITGDGTFLYGMFVTPTLAGLPSTTIFRGIGIVTNTNTAYISNGVIWTALGGNVVTALNSKYQLVTGTTLVNINGGAPVILLGIQFSGAVVTGAVETTNSACFVRDASNSNALLIQVNAGQVTTGISGLFTFGQGVYIPSLSLNWSGNSDKALVYYLLP